MATSRPTPIAWTLALLLGACASNPKPGTPSAAAPAVPDAAARMSALADRYFDAVIARDPTIGYFVDVPIPAHDRFPDNSSAGMDAWARQEDAFADELARIDPAALRGSPMAIVHGFMRENLDGARGLRVCRGERWTVNHMGGWQAYAPQVAQAQPVETPELRAQALARWRGFGRYLDNEIANLRTGLATGYTVPRPVAARTLQQIESMAAAKSEESPLYAPAARAKDAAFAAEYLQVMRESIEPALRRYRDFLRDEYLPRARETLAVTALPDGEACYRALLRDASTLDRDAREVYELGQRTVAANEQRVAEIGERVFGTREIAAIIRRTSEAKDNRFESEQALLEFSRGMLADARAKSAALFARMPRQDAVVEPFPEFQRGSGVSSHYQPSPDPTKPGTYRIALEEWPTETRGSAEITLVHETWPGHHLQIALANEFPPPHRLLKLSFNSAYIEGWARYAERLSEEAGIYRSEYAKISRRIWPARGMVLDPGIHAFGWTREQAVDYAMATGRYDRVKAEALVDRLAAIPGQFTSYDSGGLEFFALRAEAEQALGARFDLRAFHQRLLQQGVVPMPVLRGIVEAWIAESRR